MSPFDPVRSALLTEPSRHGRGPELHELLTVEDVAALLKVSKSWVYEHTRSRGTSPEARLPHIRIGKYLRFDAESVRAFLARSARAS